MEIDRLGIVGCGLMGSGIAEVAGRAGLDVLVVEVDEGAIRAGRERVEQSLNRGVAGGKLSAAEKDVALKRITFGTDLEGLAHFPFVIEAIVEDLEAKNDLFGDLDQVCDEQAIFATNTSSLTVTDMAARTRRPERFVGVHFFNPVPVMKLVEVVRTVVTSREVLASVVELVRRLGKEPIAAKDNSGFVVNLLLVPYILDAIRHLERGGSQGRGHRQGDGPGMRAPYGAARACRLGRPGHVAQYRRDHVRRVPRKALCRASPAEASRDGWALRPEGRAGFLRLDRRNSSTAAPGLKVGYFLIRR